MGVGILIISLADSFQAGYQSQMGGGDAEASSTQSPLFVFIFIIYLVLGILVFFDLIFRGAFRKVNNKVFSKIYLWIFRFYSTVTLSFLYRPLLYNFLDNTYTRRFFYFSIPYLIILIIHDKAISYRTNPYLPKSEILMEQGFMLDDYYYDDLRVKLLAENSVKPSNNKKLLLPWVSLSHYHLNDNYQEIFFKQTKNTLRHLESNTYLPPIYDKGINFFKKEETYFVSPNIKAQKDKWDTELKKINEEKRVIRRQLRKDSNPIYQSKLDSLEKTSSLLSGLIKNEVETERKVYMKSLKNTMISNISVKIDDSNVLLKDCFFYKHPHYGEQGIKCILKLDSLEKGIHYIKVFRKNLDKNENTEIDSILLPYIKH